MVTVPNGKWWKGFTNVRHSMTKEWKNNRMKQWWLSDCYADVWWELVGRVRNNGLTPCAVGHGVYPAAYEKGWASLVVLW